MASYVCLFAMCFLVALGDSYIIRSGPVKVPLQISGDQETLKLPSQGVTIEISIKPNKEDDLAKKIKEIFTEIQDADVPHETLKEIQDKKAAKRVPHLVNRVGIDAKGCPEGFVRSGRFCVVDDDDDSEEV